MGGGNCRNECSEGGKVSAMRAKAARLDSSFSKGRVHA